MASHDLKLMCVKFGGFMMIGYEDIDDNVILQNGGWVTSRLTDHNVKVDRGPRAFIQLKRYKRFDGPIMLVGCQKSTINIAAGSHPVQ